MLIWLSSDVDAQAKPDDIGSPARAYLPGRRGRRRHCMHPPAPEPHLAPPPAELCSFMTLHHGDSSHCSATHGLSATGHLLVCALAKSSPPSALSLRAQGRAGLRLKPTWSAGVAAMLEVLGSSTEPALDPAGIMARWLCRNVLLMRRPLARPCLPS